MTSGVLITLIIVAGFVLVCMMGIAFAWWATAHSGVPLGGDDRIRLDSLEREMTRIRDEVNRLRQHQP